MGADNGRRPGFSFGDIAMAKANLVVFSFLHSSTADVQLRSASDQLASGLYSVIAAAIVAV